MAAGSPGSVPRPPRPLGPTGRAVWRRVWTGPKRAWIDREHDLDHVGLLCESIDERAELRQRVIDGMDDHRRQAVLDLIEDTVLDDDTAKALREWVANRSTEWRDRVALRALDEQIERLMSKLGLNPTDRAELGVEASAKRGGKLQEMRDARKP